MEKDSNKRNSVLNIICIICSLVCLFGLKFPLVVSDHWLTLTGEFFLSFVGSILDVIPMILCWLQFLFSVLALIWSIVSWIKNTRCPIVVPIGCLVFSILYALEGLVYMIIDAAKFSEYFYTLAYIPMVFEIICVIVFRAYGGKESMAYGRKEKGEGSRSMSTDGEFSIGIHVLLLLITFGIWNLIWTYRTTKFLNSQMDEKKYRNPTTKLLLCMFVPFYAIYWTYVTAKYVEEAFRKQGRNTEIATISLILALFVSFVPPILIQVKINELCNGNQTLPQSVPTETQNVEAIKQFKELYDTGLITEEEYEQKKKQLLGL